MIPAFDVRTVDLNGVLKARPFLSTPAWATYSVIVTIAYHMAMMMDVLRGGIGDYTKFLNTEGVKQIIKAILPECSEYVDRVGSQGYHVILEQLEARLFQQVQAMLSGVEYDKAAVEQAAEIVRRSVELRNKDLQAASGAVESLQTIEGSPRK
jgi:hypothetical protein